MIELSNMDVLEVLRDFKLHSIDVAFLVPTATGLEKSIMDAHSDVNAFLKKSGIHSYDLQSQGPDNKKLINTTLINGKEIIKTKTSLYRPNTKFGDPRLWIYELAQHVVAGDLLALMEGNNELVVINCSKTNVVETLKSINLVESCDSRIISDRSSKLIISDLNENNIVRLDDGFNRSIINPLKEIMVMASAPEESQEFIELLGLLKDISKKGYVKTLRSGDTGVGYTLETLLNIKANSSKSPDYKGIEVKSSRSKTHNRGQVTIFAQVPDWSVSPLKGSKEILKTRGVYSQEKKRNQLFHEISAISPNSYGLKLEVDHINAQIFQTFISDSRKEVDVVWAIKLLQERLLHKHKESVWVSAKNTGKGDEEMFYYDSLKHTKNVDCDILPFLIEQGAITVHYTISETPNGGAKDKGYLFKTAVKNLDLLFANVKLHKL